MRLRSSKIIIGCLVCELLHPPTQRFIYLTGVYSLHRRAVAFLLAPPPPPFSLSLCGKLKGPDGQAKSTGFILMGPVSQALNWGHTEWPVRQANQEWRTERKGQLDRI